MMTLCQPTASETERIATCFEVLKELKRAKRAARTLYAAEIESATRGPEDEQQAVDDKDCEDDDKRLSNNHRPPVTPLLGLLAVGLVPSGLQG